MRSSDKSKLKAAIFVSSASGLTYDAMVNQLVMKAYLDHGGGVDRLRDDALARLCQGGGVKRKREDRDYTSVFSQAGGIG